MILLSARGISRQFDTDPVFRDVSFDVRPGERIGLIGPNGAGKTTLLKILVGLDEADIGQIERHPSADVALLQQEADFPDDRSLLDEAKAGLAALYELQRESAEIAATMASERDPERSARLHKRYDHLQSELHRLGAYNVDHRVDEVLHGLGFDRDEYAKPLSTLSGGQRNRALLAKMLLRAPDLMLLDEPTNHLDIAATEWLEAWLANSGQAMLIVSHDRYFLDRVVNHVFELQGGRVTDYAGNFSAYWSQRTERQKVLERTYERQQEYIADAEEFIRRNKMGQKSAQAHDREKKIARLEEIERPTEIAEPAMTFEASGRPGDWIIEAQNIRKGFDRPLFAEFSFRLDREDAVGILGPNGCGKTTLLRTLLGEISPEEGTVRFGTGIKIGYFDQRLTSVDPALTAIDAVRPADRPDVTPGQLRSLLARFGVRGELALQKVGQMSGGEKSKVALAKLAAQNVNVLVLDEPTNHLDLWARDSLEQALQAYEGTLLFVSHDRYFVNRIARKVIVCEDSTWRIFEGNYSDYVHFCEERRKELAGATQPTIDKTAPKSAESESGRSKPSRRKREFPYRKVEDLEQEIAETEETVRQLEAEMADPAIHRAPDRLREATLQYDEQKTRLESLYRHWEESVELN